MGQPLTVERLYEQILHTMVPVKKNKPDVSASEELLKRARMLAHCGYVKQAASEYFAILSTQALPYLHAICEKLEISYDEFLYLADFEIVDALSGTISSKDLREKSHNRHTMNVATFSGKNNEMVFVENDHEYLYSSARDYCGIKGLVKIIMD